MVRGGGFTENGAEFSILGLVMAFMDLDSSVKFFLYVQMYVLTWSISGMRFQYNLALTTAICGGFCMGKAILAAKPSMCQRILSTPDA